MLVKKLIETITTNFSFVILAGTMPAKNSKKRYLVIHLANMHNIACAINVRAPKKCTIIVRSYFADTWQC